MVLGLALPGCRDQGTPTAPGAKALTASVTPADPAGRHLVVFTAERVPAAFADRIAQLGGTIEAALDSIGVATATGLSETAATQLRAAPDIRAVEPDPMTSPRDDGEATDGLADEAP
ncbi:MAG TPA: hypothetical protein VEL29_06325, partial [Gemmatimonadales bacterium]|nr:hypothetical protein [Gemmatimonadales bacterium]